MKSFDNVYRNPFPHEIIATIKGLAGETKTVAVLPSNDKLLLFRGFTVKGSDTVGGEGTILREIKILGKKQLRRASLTSQIDWLFNRGIAFDTVHPRSPVEFVIEFKRECEWTGLIAGQAIEVANEGVYATAPTIACGRSVPEAVHTVVGYWNLQNASVARCEHCWFKFGEHAAFPWRERNIDVDIEHLDAGSTHDFEIDFTNSVIPHSATMYDHSIRGAFITPGFARAVDFRHGTRPPVPFDYYSSPNYGQTLYALQGSDRFVLRVINKSDVGHPFKARVRVEDLLPGGMSVPNSLSASSGLDI